MDAAPAPHAAERRVLLLVIAGGIALRLIWRAKVHGGIVRLTTRRQPAR